MSKPPPPPSDPVTIAALLAEARHPGTASGRLRELADRREEVPRTRTPHPFWRVLEAVAENANTPLDVLLALVPYCRDAFCRNPVAPLLALEAPDALLGQDHRVASALLRWPDAPPALIGVLALGAQHPETREEARLHVCGPDGELAPGDDWAAAIRDFWRAHAAGAEGERRATYQELAALEMAPPWAAGTDAPPEPFPDSELDALLSAGYMAHPEAADRISRARNPATLPGDLFKMLHRSFKDAAGPPSVFVSLRSFGVAPTRGADWYVRLALAANPASPTPLLNELAAHVPRSGELDEPIRMCLACHPNGDRQLVLGLVKGGAGTTTGGLRRLLWAHPAAPPPDSEEGREFRRRLRYLAQEWLSVGGPLSRFVSLLAWDEDGSVVAALRTAHLTVEPWWDRLAAAVMLPPREAPEAMAALARDGNRLVSAAARARFADPSQEFRL